LVFTLRGDKIRIISARDMSKKGAITRAKKVIPKFKSENDERRFWAEHDSTDFVDYSKGEKILFSDLRPSLKTVSIRLPSSLIESLKTLAYKNDVPYQSFVKMVLAERVKEELQIG